jgi:hypothetical protein
MIIISHRGNLEGSKPELENKPEYIDKALAAGYHVEVDIRYFNGQFYLGHDSPDYPVSLIWIIERNNRILWHCKNFEAASSFSIHPIKTVSFFCHSLDPYVLISNGYIWVHDLSLSVDENCIIPLINEEWFKKYPEVRKVGGICTDVVKLAHEYAAKRYSIDHPDGGNR